MVQTSVAIFYILSFEKYPTVVPLYSNKDF